VAAIIAYSRRLSHFVTSDPDSATAMLDARPSGTKPRHASIAESGRQTPVARNDAALGKMRIRKD
jgi:hypothetical protein